MPEDERVGAGGRPRCRGGGGGVPNEVRDDEAISKLECEVDCFAEFALRGVRLPHWSLP